MENGRNCPRNTPERSSQAKGPAPAEGRPPPLPALTEIQKDFAARHHSLIYTYLIRRQLDIPAYYDIAALGYLQAVRRYLTQPQLACYPFSTLAWRAMRRSLAVYFRAEQRQLAVRLRLSDCLREKEALLWQELDAHLLLVDLLRIATPEQRALVRLRLEGHSIAGTARAMGLSSRRVSKRLKRLYQTYLRMEGLNP